MEHNWRNLSFYISNRYDSALSIMHIFRTSNSYCNMLDMLKLWHDNQTMVWFSFWWNTFIQLRISLIITNHILNINYVTATMVWFSFWRILLSGIKCWLYALDDSNYRRMLDLVIERHILIWSFLNIKNSIESRK